ncbi:MAG: hypothetical protein ATN36_06465 [Epulopiscium sp. Nele67-Bin005]|nr:MAG: hypothetical protein ATN36_06465 [Epulopiscium sp. Nele67-Bin005]
MIQKMLTLNERQFSEFKLALADYIFEKAETIQPVVKSYLEERDQSVNIEHLKSISLPATPESIKFEPARAYYDEVNNLYVTVDYYFEDQPAPQLAVCNSCSEIIKYHFAQNPNLSTNINKCKMPTIVPIVLNYHQIQRLEDYQVTNSDAHGIVSVPFYAFNINQYSVRWTVQKSPNILLAYLTRTTTYENFLDELRRVLPLASEEVCLKLIEILLNINYPGVVSDIEAELRKLETVAKEEIPEHVRQVLNSTKNIEETAHEANVTKFEASLIKLIN